MWTTSTTIDEDNVMAVHNPPHPGEIVRRSVSTRSAFP